MGQPVHSEEKRLKGLASEQWNKRWSFGPRNAVCNSTLVKVKRESRGNGPGHSEYKD